jgi:hypothetical protein
MNMPPEDAKWSPKLTSRAAVVITNPSPRFPLHLTILGTFVDFEYFLLALKSVDRQYGSAWVGYRLVTGLNHTITKSQGSNQTHMGLGLGLVMTMVNKTCMVTVFVYSSDRERRNAKFNVYSACYTFSRLD